MSFYSGIRHFLVYDLAHMLSHCFQQAKMQRISKKRGRFRSEYATRYTIVFASSLDAPHGQQSRVYMSNNGILEILLTVAPHGTRDSSWQHGCMRAASRLVRDGVWQYVEEYSNKILQAQVEPAAAFQANESASKKLRNRL